MPEQNAIAAITSGTNDMQGVMNAVWTHLLPAMNSAAVETDSEAASELADRLRKLAIPAPRHMASSPEETEFAGQYRLEDNPYKWEAFAIRFDEREAGIRIQDNHGEHDIRCGRGAWIEQTARVNQGKEQRIAASFAWLDTGTLELTVRYVETPFCHSVVCRLNGTDLMIEAKPNVGFGPSDSTPIRGTRT
jgi:hypothetical protein